MRRDHRLQLASAAAGLEIVLPPYGDEFLAPVVFGIVAGGAIMPESNTFDQIHVNSPASRGEGNNAGRQFVGERHLTRVEDKAYKEPDRSYAFSTGGAYALPGHELPQRGDRFPVRDVQTLSFRPLPGNMPEVMTREPLIYRSGTTPRREGRIQRALPANVTNPRINATFVDGSQGDIYGRR